MTHEEIKNYFWLSLSIIMHFMLILALTTAFHFSNQKKKMLTGFPNRMEITAYLYQERGAKTPNRMARKLNKFKKTISFLMQPKALVLLQKKLNTKENKIKKVNTINRNKIHKEKVPPSHGEQVSILLTLLHQAIQKRQHYPEAAMEMGREGRVTVTFSLSVDGEIQGLVVTKSSATQSLDDAAIAAVKEAAPFKKISAYLHSTQLFHIDVVFKLT